MITPREYLSWSSMNLLERDEEKWKELYFYDKRMRINRGMAFGKVLADTLETGVETGDPIVDLVTERIPKYDIRDKELMSHLMDGKEKIKLIFRPDSITNDWRKFLEYKSAGVNDRWTQRKVMDMGQIPFYGTCIFLEKKIIPQADLVEIWTEQDEETQRVSPTGDIRTFHRPLTMVDVLNMMVRMKKAWRRIKQLSEDELL